MDINLPATREILISSSNLVSRWWIGPPLDRVTGSGEKKKENNGARSTRWTRKSWARNSYVASLIAVPLFFIFFNARSLPRKFFFSPLFFDTKNHEPTVIIPQAFTIQSHVDHLLINSIFFNFLFASGNYSHWWLGDAKSGIGDIL